MTLFPMGGIVELTSFEVAVFAASFFPATFGGLYLRSGTDIAALSSMISSNSSECIMALFIQTKI